MLEGSYMEQKVVSCCYIYTANTNPNQRISITKIGGFFTSAI